MESGVVDSVAFAQHAHLSFRTIDLADWGASGRECCRAGRARGGNRFGRRRQQRGAHPITPIEVAVALSIFLIVLVVIGVRVAFATAFIGIAGLFLIFAVDKAQGFERGLAERGDAVPPDHAVF